MNQFKSLIAATDAIVMQQFADRFRWVKEDGSTQDIDAIVDLQVEMLTPGGDVGYLGKTVTVRAAQLVGFQRGDMLKELDNDGNLTGVEYRLSGKILGSDGGLKTIEVTT